MLGRCCTECAHHTGAACVVSRPLVLKHVVWWLACLPFSIAWCSSTSQCLPRRKAYAALDVKLIRTLHLAPSLGGASRYSSFGMPHQVAGDSGYFVLARLLRRLSVARFAGHVESSDIGLW